MVTGVALGLESYAVRYKDDWYLMLTPGCYITDKENWHLGHTMSYTISAVAAVTLDLPHARDPKFPVLVEGARLVDNLDIKEQHTIRDKTIYLNHRPPYHFLSFKHNGNSVAPTASSENAYKFDLPDGAVVDVVIGLKNAYAHIDLDRIQAMHHQGLLTLRSEYPLGPTKLSDWTNGSADTTIANTISTVVNGPHVFSVDVTINTGGLILHGDTTVSSFTIGRQWLSVSSNSIITIQALGSSDNTVHGAHLVRTVPSDNGFLIDRITRESYVSFAPYATVATGSAYFQSEPLSPTEPVMVKLLLWGKTEGDNPAEVPYTGPVASSVPAIIKTIVPGEYWIISEAPSFTITANGLTIPITTTRPVQNAGEYPEILLDIKSNYDRNVHEVSCDLYSFEYGWKPVKISEEVPCKLTVVGGKFEGGEEVLVGTTKTKYIVNGGEYIYASLTYSSINIESQRYLLPSEATVSLEEVI